MPARPCSLLTCVRFALRAPAKRLCCLAVVLAITPTAAQILVRTPTGSGEVVRVSSDDTVESLFASIEKATNVAVANQRVTKGARVLEAGHKLSEYDIHPNCFVTLTNTATPSPQATASGGKDPQASPATRV
jgi:hypothetical protein